MLWIGLLAILLIIAAGSLPMAGSAQACDFRVTPCEAAPSPANYPSGINPNPATRQLTVTTAPGVAHGHLPSRRLRVVLAPHRSPLMAARVDASNDRRAAASGLQTVAKVMDSGPANAKQAEPDHSVALAMVSLPVATWNPDATLKLETNPPNRGEFDVVAEWKHAVSMLATVNVWPEQMLRTFDEFPP